jgi:glucokinase
MRFLGIDVGGTTIKAGLVDESGRILESSRAETITNNLGGFLSTLTEMVHAFQRSATIDAIGIGVPGLRSSKTHIIETSPNIPCLQKINLEDLLADQVHIRTVSENDANAAAYAEYVCGAGAGHQHLAYLTLGTGLGSGFVLNGKLFTGTSGYAGELGHTVLSVAANDQIGRQCNCGNRGCLEMFVSGTGIVLTAEEMMQKAPESVLHDLEWPLTAESIYSAAVRGDATAVAVFKETGRYLGIACANLINLLNLQMIIIGGGVMAAGRLLLDATLDSAQRHAFPAPYADCQIVQSTLWPDAGMIGAAMIARDR